MSTALTAIILIALVAIVIALLVKKDSKENRQQQKEVLDHFSEAGMRFGLNFSSNELLRECMIGLDAVQGKLLVMPLSRDRSPFTFVVDLADIRSCLVVRSFLKTEGESARPRPGAPLQSIHVQLALYTQERFINIPFYNHVTDHLEDISELELKAGQWCDAIRKLSQFNTMNIA